MFKDNIIQKDDFFSKSREKPHDKMLD